MTDPRYQKLAEILADYSISVQSGDRVWIRSIGVPALTLAREVSTVLLVRGAHPYLDISDEQMGPVFYRHANSDQLFAPPSIEEAIVSWADKVITIIGEENTRALASADQGKLISRAKILKPIRDQILTKPWVLTWVPTAALAQDAGMSLDDFETFYFAATLRDWKRERSQAQKLGKWLTARSTIRIQGKGTDLSLSVENRRWIADGGECNMPGGEVFSAPVDGSANGRITFDFPVLRAGRTISGITLDFSDGVVTAAHAVGNDEYFQSLLNQDEGARRLGEVAIGLNTGIPHGMLNTLFDEKIGGTIHLALGAAYAECGGTNQSSLHLDLVKDMRHVGSTLTVDGEKLLRDGRIDWAVLSVDPPESAK